jgi:serine/threonine-protein kinase RsbW
VRAMLLLALPREALSVPITRRIFGASMRTIGVSEECVSDIQVALTEACTNVVHHGEDHQHYEVACYLDDSKCVIEVSDRGRGFDFNNVGLDNADVDSEAGRGIQLMRRLVDRMRFDRRPRGGTVVRLEKLLDWRDGPLLSGGPDAGALA